ncbi:glycerophosphodiester phosphodiesterase family protein [Paenibacillus sp. 1011MAR3C5]|uniref:glycerophosphodiester phosphodiesterase family protein n=1 Tax=Paenibacillus sp. 1011MAR3C5 TaxID=1675787 RepID=UPI0016015971|nr:glycerophosphodiester phosphodiesterase family protein [Paenibacillus sp. 1011MAR3C5]
MRRASKLLSAIICMTLLCGLLPPMQSIRAEDFPVADHLATEADNSPQEDELEEGAQQESDELAEDSGDTEPVETEAPADEEGTDGSEESGQPEEGNQEEAAELAAAAPLERQALSVPKTDYAPVIDGKLDDMNWSLDQPIERLPGGVLPEDAPGAPLASFGALWDQQYLYVGVRIEDDTPLAQQSGYWFDQDSVSLFVDPSLHRSSPFAANDMQAGFIFREQSATPQFSFGAALSNHAGKDDKGIMRAMSKTDSGWELEVAISWELLQFDPQLSRELGLEIGVTDRFGEDTAMQRSAYWSAYESSSFWNDTSGYGTLTLSDDIVSGPSDPILLQESFDSIPDGELPADWISDVNAGSPPFSVSNGRLELEGNASGAQSRVTAPVQWDNYTVEADLQFHSVLNAARWASLIFRGTTEGKQPYNQMAIRQNGSYEVAYRKPDNGWSVIASGPWQPLALNENYTMKVRVFGDNVKEYIKPAASDEYVQLIDRSFSQDLLKRGKIGFQVDQAHVSFDNLVVTRLTAETINLTLPPQLEALSGPVAFTATIDYSDGISEPVDPAKLKLYSSDESILKVVGGQLYPIREGTATVTAVYANAEAAYEVSVSESQTGAKVVSMKHEQGFELATVGTPVELAYWSFQAERSDFTSGTVQGGELEWMAEGDGVEIAEGKLHVKSSGVHRVTGSIDGVSITLLVVAKKQDEVSYVLYENNFDRLADGSMPEGWTRKEGTTASRATVRDGAFELHASAAPDNPSRVLLPDYLGLFGDYKIEADVTHLNANDTARWHSIMFRIQNGDYPYYQMAVRQDATAANGIEFAERNPANGWSILDKGPFKERIDASKMYHYTVVAKGNRVQEWINDSLIIDTDSAAAYAKGHIGLQSNGSVMRVDNLKVTLQLEELPPMPADRFADVYEPDTKIVMGPTIVTELTNAEGLSLLSGSATPATVILHVDEKLNVVAPSNLNTVLSDVPSVMELIEGKIIPAFYVHSEKAADAIAAYAEANGLEDAFVISDHGEWISRVRAAVPMVRGILDFSSATVTKDSLLAIRRETTISGSKIAILPQAAATKGHVEYLQQRTIVVWTKEKAASADRSLAMHELIATGTNGILTGAPEAAFDALAVYSNATTLIRKPYIIGHRGMPSRSPENTIESNLMAYENGADYIENDMYVTSDDHLVIIHDSVLQNTTNGTGNVESFTLEEIKKLNANKPYPNGFPDVKVPTLEEQIELARDKGIMVYAEIKTANPRAVDVLVELIEEQNAEDLINVMAFHSSQLRLFSEKLPGMPVGLLVGSGSETDINVGKALRDTIRTTQSLNSTYNAGFIGMGPAYMEASKHRGIIISPWTINGLADYTDFFLRGAFGITTDYAYYSADWNVALKAKQQSYSLKRNEGLTLTAIAETYKRTNSEVVPDIVWLQGEELFEAAGNTLKAQKSGTASLLLRYTTHLDSGEAYDLYTAPIHITVVQSSGNGGGGGGQTGEETGTAGCEVLPAAGSSVSLTISEGGAACEQAVREALQSAASVHVQFKGDTWRIAADAWTESSRTKNGTLSVSNEWATYRIPAAVWNPKLWTSISGVDPSALQVRFSIKKATNEEHESALKAVEQAGGKLLSKVIAFEIELVDEAGKAWPVPLGTAYATRDIAFKTSGDAEHTTALQFMPNTGELQFVPSRFSFEGDKAIAHMKRNGNSIYLIAAYDKSFADTNGHWAQQDIELAANKGLINGVSSDQFLPERSITRAEFASMLVRALGLADGTADRTFSDVPADRWYARDVAAAVKAGVIKGYGDHTFRPEQLITREDQAAMLIRALTYAGASVPAMEHAESLLQQQFKDADGIVWAHEELAAAVKLGLLKGMQGDILQADRHSTRAQSAALLVRFLTIAVFI